MLTRGITSSSSSLLIISSFSLILFNIMVVNEVRGQIPYECGANVTLGYKTCCPTSGKNNEVCGGARRGICFPIRVYHENVRKVFLQDDRYEWPKRFFHRMCQCRGNYYGAACESCYFGWKGKYCNETIKYIRRDIKTYSTKEKDAFRNIVKRSDEIKSPYLLVYEADSIHSDPLWRPKLIGTTVHKYMTAMHRYASRATLYKNREKCAENGFLDYNHGVTMFAMWHRYFMLIWERALRKIAVEEFGVKDFAIPYWDWIDATKCDVCTNELVGAPGKILEDKGIQLLDENSPFYKFKEYCQPPNTGQRCFGCHFKKHFEPLNRHWNAYEFPTSKDLEFVLSKKIFYIPNEGRNQCDSFHKAFEGFCGLGKKSKYLWMHNKVHNMVTGSFCCSATASNDPLFILHHSQVDRIVQVWYNKYKPKAATLPTSGRTPGQMRDSNIVSFIPTVRNRDMFKDIKLLGFNYDNFAFGKHGLNYDEF